ncbi:MAG: CPBP family intramembrane metalloprotease [Firmicutes bacterium]|nr:CPBP family intramembrane metalloprotease [Bacillota bacterium]
MFSLKQKALILMPLVLSISTYLCYQWLVALFGPKAGYFGGFLFYWICWGLFFSLWILGRQGFRESFRDTPFRFGRPAWLGLTLLMIPLILGFGYAFPKVLPRADLVIILASSGIALVNGTLEEVLWRGTYVKIFPGHLFLGYIYPAIGFGVWHFSPQSVFPNTAPGGSVSLVIVAGLVGLMWGWVARRTGSILWTTISHILFDFSGLGALIYFR